MPGYISHAIMGEQLYNEANKEGLLKSFISKEELRGYSLGTDLAVFSKKVIKDPHDYYTRDFFLSMIKYIKDNNLKENGSIMALLYGHIAHYFLDINTHPLIYYIECGCIKEGFLSNHDLVEGYLSSYLSKQILNKNIMNIKSDYFNQINLYDYDISKLLNNVYGKVYNDYNMVISYRKVISAFSLLENVIKSEIFSQETIIKISRFNVFLEKNKLKRSEILNENCDVFTHPFTGEKCYDSFMNLYCKSIEMSLYAIEKVNRYLYLNAPIESLLEVFKDLSYNTGTSCTADKQMIYVRKYKG